MGILRFRAHSHDPIRCVIEADHIHNLPGLVGNDSRSSLLDDRDVERPAFIERIPDADRAAFEALWDELRDHATAHAVASMH